MIVIIITVIIIILTIILIQVFAGVVGTSGNRREYSVIGDSVNLSARMMGTACKSADHRIMVSEETVRAS